MSVAKFISIADSFNVFYTVHVCVHQVIANCEFFIRTRRRFGQIKWFQNDDNLLFAHNIYFGSLISKKSCILTSRPWNHFRKQMFSVPNNRRLRVPTCVRGVFFPFLPKQVSNKRWHTLSNLLLPIFALLPWRLRCIKRLLLKIWRTTINICNTGHKKKLGTRDSHQKKILRKKKYEKIDTQKPNGTVCHCFFFFSLRLAYLSAWTSHLDWPFGFYSIETYMYTIYTYRTSLQIYCNLFHDVNTKWDIWPHVTWPGVCNKCTSAPYRSQTVFTI